MTLPACAADQITRALLTPTPVPADQAWLAHSLTRGAAGISLLHTERAHQHLGDWNTAHAWLTAAAAGVVSAADTTGLYQGIASLGFALDAAARTSSHRYATALAGLDTHLDTLTHRRVDAATQRIASGTPGHFREYDVFFGLTGIGALLARRDPGGAALERTLSYLVALTVPVHVDGRTVPGWWVGHDPHRRRSDAYPSGHANLGAAHGITGVLLLLARTARDGLTVTGQHDAIAEILAFLDQWEQDSEHGPWWPQWLTLQDLDTGRPTQSAPGKPSWCYGTPAIARAQQIAALATGDSTRQHRSQTALTKTLLDAVERERINDVGLCHGWAGTFQTGWRAALDAQDPELDAAVASTAQALARAADFGRGPGDEPGLLDGTAGLALALTTAALDAAPISGWDACLLID
jgi:lantibiotic biosynthesis protein